MRPYIRLWVWIAGFMFVLATIVVVVVSSASYVLVRDLVLDMRVSNLDLNTRMKNSQGQRHLLQMRNLLLHVVVSPATQWLLQGFGTDRFDSNVASLDTLLTNSTMVSLKVYSNDLSSIANLTTTEPNAGPRALDAVRMAWDGDEVPLNMAREKGIYVSRPYPAYTDPKLGYILYMGMTVPLIRSSPIARYESERDLIPGNNTLQLGWVTGIFSCARLQSYFGDNGAEEEIANTSTVWGILNPDFAMDVLYVSSAGALARNTSEIGLEPHMYADLLNNTDPRAGVDVGPLGSTLSVTSMKFRNQHFVVAVLQGRSTMYGEAHTLRKWLLVASILIALLLSASAGLLALYGSRPLRKLREAAFHKHSSRGPPRTVGLQKNRSPFRHFTRLGNLRKQVHNAVFAGVPSRVILSRKHLRDEFDIIIDRWNQLTLALDHQSLKLEETVGERKRQIKDATDTAREANAAKSHFLARVTHELRTPLNGILGTATLCLTEDSTPKLHESLKIIYKCGELLLHLLTELLSFSRNEVENFELCDREFMISEITDQLAAIFKEQSDSAGIKLEIVPVKECEKMIVLGDINRILQVIFNLISNSLKFTPAGGKITFTVDVRDDEHCESLKIFTFEVHDTGPGIAENLQTKIFDAFVQGDLEPYSRKAGVGLGLSICKQLARRMSGDISLRSKLGEGSVFSFTVPLRTVHSSPQTSSASDQVTFPEYETYTADTISRHADAIFDPQLKSPVTPEKGQSDSEQESVRPRLTSRAKSYEFTVKSDLRVLVADDNKVNQEVLVRMLKLEGIVDIELANDGLEVIEKVKGSQKPFDVIFMDVQMPNLDGLCTTRILHEEFQFEAPIVAVSAFANETNVESCTEAGMTAFLAKPIRRPFLRKILLNIGEQE